MQQAVEPAEPARSHFGVHENYMHVLAIRPDTGMDGGLRATTVWSCPAWSKVKKQSKLKRLVEDQTRAENVDNTYAIGVPNINPK